MQVATIKDIILESSSVAASSLSEYNSGTAYTVGNKVKVSYESDGVTARTPVVEYEALGSTTGDYPPTSPTAWSETGTSNQWKMFDEYLNSTTSDTSAIEVEVTSNRSDMVGLFRLTGSSVVFELWRDSVLLDTETVQLAHSPESGWHSWYYDGFEYKTKAFWEYTKYLDATLKVTIAPSGGTAICGEMVIGAKVELGTTQYDASVGITDYSVISEDALGRLYLSQGNYADRSDVSLWIDNTKIDLVRNRLAALRGTLALWDMNNAGSDYDSLRIYGYFKNFDIVIPGPTRSKCNIEIGGNT